MTYTITPDSLNGTFKGARLNSITASNSSFRGLGGRLLCVFALIACMPLQLHAGKNEYCSVLNLMQNHTQLQNKQATASVFINIINIYIAEDAQFYIEDGAKLIISSGQSLAKPVKDEKAGNKVAVIKEETPEQAENKITEQESTTVVVPVFPFESSSSSFLKSVGESATTSSQQRINEYQQDAKTCREYTYQNINSADLSLYHPEQRQKLSTAATQCGLMTSFESTSPPAKSSLLRRKRLAMAI